MDSPLLFRGKQNKRLFCPGLMLLALTLPASKAQAMPLAIYSFDAARSRLELAVSRSGLLKIAGHDHKIQAKSFSGEVRYGTQKLEASSVNLSVESASLVVLDDPNEPEKDRREVQATMEGAEVLNIAKFPKILFRSTRINNVSRTGEDFRLTGILNLHGVEKEIAFPVHIHQENNLLRATGTVTVDQTDFGIKPVKAALGMVRVKNQVKITFDILSERTSP